ncbi:unnamed protein product [Mytilus edulis]|uniref:Zinc finger PHD-type domain-containing protein n=1 Tax=Mytilus edulis TaxID=6550 RepID=A0A8S3VEL3_MYTED|nr:unnamed protein product [Mytilus edulis]
MTGASINLTIIAECGSVYAYTSKGYTNTTTSTSTVQHMETNDAPQIPSLTCNFPEPAKDMTPSSFPSTQGIIDDLTRTIEPLTKDVVIQTTESFITNCTVIGDDCKICEEGQLDQRAIWVGCSSKSPCSYWVHARCMGICAKTKAPLSKIKFFCPKHIVSAD